jgi:hypothetical protein
LDYRYEPPVHAWILGIFEIFCDEFQEIYERKESKIATTYFI